MNANLTDVSDVLNAGPGGTSSPTAHAVTRSLDRIERLLDELTASWVNGQSLLSRRFHRVTFRQEIAIAALEEDGRTPGELPRRAVTTDISHGGLSIEHTRPLACRFLAVTICPHGGIAESFVLRLKWCRFTCQGIYRSGGTILRPHEFGWESNLRISQLPVG